MSAFSMQVYLDYAASTPVDTRVAEMMMPYFTQSFANPHSSTHDGGIAAANAVRRARREIARAISADPRGIYFTSGATEANNLAILGLANGADKSRRKIVAVKTEHSSVLEPLRYLAQNDFEIHLLHVDRNGLVDLSELQEVVDENTLLVSTMYVNNETGVIQPVADIAHIAHEHSALFHTDGSQALGRMSIDMAEMGVDLLTLSSHKAYGPKGIGALTLNNQVRSQITPVYYGGGQERGLRPGTLPVPLCVGFGEASRIAEQERVSDMKRVRELASKLLTGLQNRFPDIAVLGTHASRCPAFLNIRFPGSLAIELIDAFTGLQVAAGSACNSIDVKPSHVLHACGLTEEEANSSLRISIGRPTSEQEIDQAVGIVSDGLNKLRL